MTTVLERALDSYYGSGRVGTIRALRVIVQEGTSSLAPLDEGLALELELAALRENDALGELGQLLAESDDPSTEPPLPQMDGLLVVDRETGLPS